MMLLIFVDTGRKCELLTNLSTSLGLEVIGNSAGGEHGMEKVNPLKHGRRP